MLPSFTRLTSGLVLTLLVILTPRTALAQGVLRPWKDLSPTQISAAALQERTQTITRYRLLSIDMSSLRRGLEGAPDERAAAAVPRLLALPLPDGSEVVAEVRNSPVMMPELAGRYPQIRTFRARDRERRGFSARLGYSPYGFHAVARTPEGDVYIEPVDERSPDKLIVYYGRDLVERPDAETAFSCATHDDSTGPADEAGRRDRPVELREGEAVSLAVYRLALTCTGEYAQLKGGTLESVLAAMVRSVNLLNQIFELEVATRMMLINDNDRLIFLDPATDPFDQPTLGGELVDQSTGVINSIVTPQAYDVGHLFTAGCSDVGGVVSGRTCTGAKGAGVTCHSNNNETRINLITAHEVGHQFSCGHSWNNCPPSLDQLSSANAFEPGSGSTIMSYGGLCGMVNNVVNRSDSYYNVGSLEDFYFYSRTGNGRTCATFVETGNHAPVINLNYRRDIVIPIRTPFELTAEASDPDGDALSYCWEQYDLGPPSQLGQPLANAPSFRSFQPAASPTRVFPSLNLVLRGTDAVTEVLPRITRDLTFRCTVRDNNPEAGGVSWAEVAFRSDSTAGPFRVLTNNAADETWAAGDYREVRWDVANTDNRRVNCRRVNIRLSVDGGNTFPILLLANTPNDGSAFLTVPDTSTQRARLRVEAADNIFFDVSDRDFRITPASAPGFTAVIPEPETPSICLPAPVTFDIQTGSILGYDQALTLDLLGDLPAGATYSFSRNPVLPAANETSRLSIDLGAALEDTFRLQLRIVAPGLDTAYRELSFSTISNEFAGFAPLAPVNGERGIELFTTFSWRPTSDATRYDFELASSPAFGTSVIESAPGLAESEYTPLSLFENNRLLFWRVRPVNECGPGPYLPTQVFQTVNIACAPYPSTNVPVNISGTGRPTVESSLVVDRSGIISDVNVPLIRANYQPVKSLRITLISPAGTAVVLYDQNCGNTINFRAGFDDQAPRAIACPPDDEIVFRPVEPLARFAGENTFGTWKLRVQVVAPGFGASGAIDAWNLEFCADLTPTDPTLVTKDTLLVPPGRANLITRDLLTATDDDAGPDALTFLLVSLPRHGALLRNGDTLRLGDSFTQSDIDRFRVAYSHDDSEARDDVFSFIVLDGAGGFIPPQSFDIRVDENATVSAGEPPLAAGMRLFPNPARDEVTLRFATQPAGPLDVQIANLQGQVLSRQRFDRPAEQLTLSTAALPAGVYVISLRTRDGLATRKVVVARH